MILEGIVLSIIIGYIRKGRLANFENIEINAWYLIVGSALLQTFSISLATKASTQIGIWAANHFFAIHIVTYILLMAGLIFNYKLLSMKLLIVGTILNLLPIALNNGQMPVAIPSGVTTKAMDMGHTVVDSSTRLYFLSDIIPILKPYPLPKIISIGDIFLLIGIFMFVQYAMKLPKEAEA